MKKYKEERESERLPRIHTCVVHAEVVRAVVEAPDEEED